MRRKSIAITGLLLFLLIVTTLPALAQDQSTGKLILGGSYTLASGERLLGDLGLLGGSAILQEGSTVVGDVLVMGGSLQAAGVIRGDIALLGGAIDLASTARVEGNIVTFGGTVRRAPGAVVTGEVQIGPDLNIPGFDGAPRVPEIPPSPAASPFGWLLTQFLRLIRAMAITLAMAALALIVAMFWPSGVQTIGGAALKQPALAFVVGLLTWLLAGTATVILAVTICLLPLALVLGLILIVAALLAWITVGWLLGRKLLALLNVQQTSLVMEASIGTLILVMIYFAVSVLPCVDFIFGLIVASLGMGAIVLTRFGLQPYEPGAGSRGPVPPAPPVRRELPPAPQGEELLAAPQASPADVIYLGGDSAPLTEEAIELPAAESEPPATRSADELGLPSAAREIAEQLHERAATPAEPALRSGPAKDDLTRISDIGPVFAGRLNQAGITRFAQLAEADPETLGAIINVNPQRIAYNRWIEQARKLAELAEDAD